MVKVGLLLGARRLGNIWYEQGGDQIGEGGGGGGLQIPSSFDLTEKKNSLKNEEDCLEMHTLVKAACV